jgi:hypothetical protein
MIFIWREKFAGCLRRRAALKIALAKVANVKCSNVQIVYLTVVCRYCVVT